jgi:hypothetical protein
LTFARVSIKPSKMETKKRTESEIKEENEQIITEFAEILKKHCTGEHDAWLLVRSIRECIGAMIDERFNQEPNLFHVANCIRRTLIEKDYGIFVSEFEKMASLSSQVLILAGQNYEGITLIDNMCEDLNNLLS